VILIDAPKLVPTLDEWGVLPIAVVPFAADRIMQELGPYAPRRRDRRSDDGLALIDLTVPVASDWEGVAMSVRALAGVVDHGLFHVPHENVIVGAAA
jgi:ribose 5-phosphate isomerase A